MKSLFRQNNKKMLRIFVIIAGFILLLILIKRLLSQKESATTYLWTNYSGKNAPGNDKLGRLDVACSGGTCKIKGGKLGGVDVTGKTCKEACQNNSECTGFVLDQKGSICHFKNGVNNAVPQNSDQKLIYHNLKRG